MQNPIKPLLARITRTLQRRSPVALNEAFDPAGSALSQREQSPSGSPSAPLVPSPIQALRESEAHYRQLYEQAAAILAETEALYQVARSVVAIKSLPETLQTVAEAVAQVMGADRVLLLTFDLDKQQVNHLVKAGAGQAFLGNPAFEELWDGLSGWVLRELKPALSLKGVPDPRESPTVQQRRAATYGGSLIVVPLLHLDKAVGTLTAINRPEQRDFTDHDVDLMVELCEQASIAIQNVQLFERQVELTEENRRSLERETVLAEENRAFAERQAALAAENQRLLERSQRALQELNDQTRRLTRKGWEQTLQAEEGNLLIQDAEAGVSAPAELPALDEAIEKGEMVTSRSGTHSAMAVPIIVRGEVIGSIALEDTDVQTEWDADEVVAIQHVAEHLALALENARLYEQTQAALAESRKLADREARIAAISDRIYATTDLQGILRIAAEELRRTTGSSRAVLRLSRQ